ncbi:MAG: 2-hydroxychromene-2-carboxylate isomerase [Halieaceae bacterium]|jgi:2-hydroxychromene-2-carboxylate isomerase|nr:2-hydroxychromene-2-carboxylate isomerase [Halieaceae bacterium]
MQLEFYFDVGSPAAYLAYRRLQQLHEGGGIEVVNRPILLGGVFKATGNSAPGTVPAKGRYMLEQDLPRFALRYGVALNFNPHFPINTLQLMRGVFAARDLDCEDAYIDAVFHGMWERPDNLGDAVILVQLLQSRGLDAAAIMERSSSPDIKQALIQATEEAVGRGVFGAPTMFLGEEMFFGQDRLDFVEERVGA